MDIQIFLQRIHSEFPDLYWENSRMITQGWDHIIIVLDEKIIFRFPKNKEYTGYLKNEFPLLDYLKGKLKTGVPRYVYIAGDFSFAGYNKLEGVELKPWRFKRFPMKEKGEFARQVAHFLTELHTIPGEILSGLNIMPDNTWKEYEYLVANTRESLFPCLNHREISMIRAYFKELKTALTGKKYPEVLIHRDLTWEHILWDKEKSRINIIDFSDRGFGDPAHDFAGLWDYGRKFVGKVYEMYRGKKDEHFLRRSFLYYQRISLYIMKDALDGLPCTFSSGYEMFLKRFGLR